MTLEIVEWRKGDQSATRRGATIDLLRKRYQSRRHDDRESCCLLIQQRFARMPIVLKRKHVAGHPSVVSKAAPDLLAARPSGLSGGSLAPR